MDDTHTPSGDLLHPTSAGADPTDLAGDPPSVTDAASADDSPRLHQLASVDPADAPPIAELLASELSAELDDSATPGTDETAAGFQGAS